MPASDACLNFFGFKYRLNNTRSSVTWGPKCKTGITIWAFVHGNIPEFFILCNFCGFPDDQ